MRGRANKVSPYPKRVGIIQLSKLGDMVCTTPVFRALKEGIPEVEVVVIGSAVNGQLLAGHPHVDEYAVWGHRDIASLRLDAVVITSPGTEAFAKAYLAGVPAIVCPNIQNGRSPYETFTYKLVRGLGTVVPHRMQHYAALEYVRMLRSFGIQSSNTKKELAVSPQAQAAAREALEPYRGDLKVAIAPGAGNKIKEWPPERFGEVARSLVSRRGALIVLIGAPQDAALGEIVLDGLPKERVLNTVGRLSMEELKAYIASMDLFISADTGPVYIAEAFGVPTVDVVGPVDEREQPPRGERHAVVVPKRKKPELFVMDARTYNYKEARRQAESIEPRAVLEAAESLIGA